MDNPKITQPLEFSSTKHDYVPDAAACSPMEDQNSIDEPKLGVDLLERQTPKRPQPFVRCTPVKFLFSLFVPVIMVALYYVALVRMTGKDGMEPNFSIIPGYDISIATTYGNDTNTLLDWVALSAFSLCGVQLLALMCTVLLSYQYARPRPWPHAMSRPCLIATGLMLNVFCFREGYFSIYFDKMPPVEPPEWLDITFTFILCLGVPCVLGPWNTANVRLFLLVVGRPQLCPPRWMDPSPNPMDLNWLTLVYVFATYALQFVLSFMVSVANCMQRKSGKNTFDSLILGTDNFLNCSVVLILVLDLLISLVLYPRLKRMIWPADQPLLQLHSCFWMLSFVTLFHIVLFTIRSNPSFPRSVSVGSLILATLQAVVFYGMWAYHLVSERRVGLGDANIDIPVLEGGSVGPTVKASWSSKSISSAVTNVENGTKGAPISFEC